MTNIMLSSLSDRELLTETRRVAETERQTTAALVSVLAEVDARRLYLGEGYSSLFVFCTRALRLSEPAAYARITAARAARRFPIALTLLADGAISLTTIGLLAPHLTDDNHERVLEGARHLSKRDVERLVAGMHAQPDIEASVRALPKPVEPSEPGVLAGLPMDAAPIVRPLVTARPRVSPADAPVGRSVVSPIAPRRYLIRVTVSEETHRKLERARALLRHQIPDGNVAAIIDRALTVLIEHAERTKVAAPVPSAPNDTRRRATAAADPRPLESRSRRIPAAVRRGVWARDQGRCAFAGNDGRCIETGFIEFHHLVPFAVGGPSTVDNVQLRCRAHNAYEAARDFGDWRLRSSTRPEQASALPSPGTPSGPDGVEAKRARWKKAARPLPSSTVRYGRMAPFWGMMRGRAMQHLQSIDDLDAAVRRSHERPVVIFKHSATCGTSAMAMAEIEDFAAAESSADVVLVSVQSAAPVSAEIASRFGVRHESPQALVLDRGVVIWRGSHFRVSHKHLAAAMARIGAVKETDAPRPTTTATADHATHTHRRTARDR